MAWGRVASWEHTHLVLLHTYRASCVPPRACRIAPLRTSRTGTLIVRPPHDCACPSSFGPLHIQDHLAPSAQYDLGEFLRLAHRDPHRVQEAEQSKDSPDALVIGGEGSHQAK